MLDFIHLWWWDWKHKASKIKRCGPMFLSMWCFWLAYGIQNFARQTVQNPKTRTKKTDDQKWLSDNWKSSSTENIRLLIKNLYCGFASAASSDPEGVSVHKVPLLWWYLEHEPLGDRNTDCKGKYEKLYKIQFFLKQRYKIRLSFSFASSTGHRCMKTLKRQR